VTHEIAIEPDPAFEASVAEAELEALLGDALEREHLDEEIALTVVVTADERLRELNREHRGIDETTDVLSFPAEEGDEFPEPEEGARYLGDIAVSLPEVRRRASVAGIDETLELRHVVLHGLLHLLGYDHESDEEAAEMAAREEALLGAGIHAGRAPGAHD
jgi:probable rRNA maturation factor